MALNPQYADIGNGFVQQYYGFFDDPAQRANVVNFYSVSNLVYQANPGGSRMILKSNYFQATESFMTFEGQQIQGSAKIMEKLSVRI